MPDPLVEDASTYRLNSPSLADGRWHHIRIRRRADYLEVVVDNRHTQKGIIPKLEDTFEIIGQQVYVGGESPYDFRPYTPPRLGQWTTPEQTLKFVGQMRNFYWN
ncbi:Neurexin-3-beta, partial [Cichlidogyrus casuarinus]